MWGEDKICARKRLDNIKVCKENTQEWLEIGMQEAKDKKQNKRCRAEVVKGWKMKKN